MALARLAWLANASSWDALCRLVCRHPDGLFLLRDGRRKAIASLRMQADGTLCAVWWGITQRLLFTSQRTGYTCSFLADAGNCNACALRRVRIQYTSFSIAGQRGDARAGRYGDTGNCMRVIGVWYRLAGVSRADECASHNPCAGSACSLRVLVGRRWYALPPTCQNALNHVQ